MIRSFLFQDIPRHPDTRLFEVREAFKRSLLPGTWFSVAYSRIYRNIFSPPPALRGPCGGLALCAQQTPNQQLMPCLALLIVCLLCLVHIL